MYNFIRSCITQACYGCDRPTASAAGLCACCFANMPWQPASLCQGCNLVITQKPCQLCGSCLQTYRPYQRLITACRYTGMIQQMISGLKFGAELSYRQSLAALLMPKISKEKSVQALLPVPLHWRRLIKRGFNQAIEIAKPISQHLQLPIIRHAVKRIQHTAPQAQTHGQARHHKMHQVFAVCRPLPFTSIAIIDDVFTTGATVAGLATCLRDAGVPDIQVWCVARTMPHL